MSRSLSGETKIHSVLEKYPRLLMGILYYNLRTSTHKGWNQKSSLLDSFKACQMFSARAQTHHRGLSRLAPDVSEGNRSAPN